MTKSDDADFRVTVGLMWHSLGSGNLGVGALTESNIALVRQAAEAHGLRVRFIIFGTSASSNAALATELEAAGHTLEVRRIRVFRREFRDAVRECDLVLDIGEGDSFSDIYGLKRFLFYWLSKNIVCSAGVPLVLSPQTIGPFNSSLARLLAKQVMRRCRMIFARDHLSGDYLRQLGMHGNTSEAIDVAFKLPFLRSSHPGEKIKFGLNVSGLLFSGGYTRNNQFGLTIDYPAAMRQLLVQLCSLPDVEVHLISHVIEPNMPVEDDVHAAGELQKEFPSVHVVPVFKRPSEAKSYIAGMDFFVGARMHACIAAFSSGVPVVPVAYSRKFNGLFGVLGYRVLADGKATTDAELIQTVLCAYEDRVALREEVARGVASARERLKAYENLLSSELSRARARALHAA